MISILLSPLVPWMPSPESDFAQEIDWLYAFIFWISVFFFVLITVLTAWFAWKYRRGETIKLTPRITHDLRLELTWSLIPAFLILIIAFWGFNTFIKGAVAPSDSYEVLVTGKQWLWQFEHPNGTVETGELHLPLGKSVKLVMSSTDVLHSFFIPDYRVKHDVVPGRYTSIWFEPKKVGGHQVFCTEYCGDSHSGMLANIYVMTPEDYKAWEKGITQVEPTAENGRKIYEKAGCATCHSIDGSRLVGPSFKGLWGTPQPIVGGSPIMPDENYLRESILEPQAKIVDGYQGQAMPAFKGVLNDSQVNAVIAYIKSLK